MLVIFITIDTNRATMSGPTHTSKGRHIITSHKQPKSKDLELSAAEGLLHLAAGRHGVGLVLAVPSLGPLAGSSTEAGLVLAEGLVVATATNGVDEVLAVVQLDDIVAVVLEVLGVLAAGLAPGLGVVFVALGLAVADVEGLAGGGDLVGEVDVEVALDAAVVVDVDAVLAKVDIAAAVVEDGDGLVVLGAFSVASEGEVASGLLAGEGTAVELLLGATPFTAAYALALAGSGDVATVLVVVVVVHDLVAVVDGDDLLAELAALRVEVLLQTASGSAGRGMEGGRVRSRVGSRESGRVAGRVAGRVGGGEAGRVGGGEARRVAGRVRGGERSRVRGGERSRVRGRHRGDEGAGVVSV